MSLAETAYNFAEAAWEVVSGHPLDTGICVLLLAFGTAGALMSYKEHKTNRADDEAAEARIAKINPGVFKRENFEP